MSIFKKLLAVLITSSITLPALAMTAVDTGLVYIDSVSVVAVASFGHKAGNLEIKITNGISNMGGLNCDPNYVTTLNTVTNFNQMVSLLLAAQISQKPVHLGITDDSSLTAIGGRCSLVAVGLYNK